LLLAGYLPHCPSGFNNLKSMWKIASVFTSLLFTTYNERTLHEKLHLMNRAFIGSVFIISQNNKYRTNKNQPLLTTEFTYTRFIITLDRNDLCWFISSVWTKCYLFAK